MFFKPHPGLGPQCPICAGMLLSIACYENKTLVERNEKKQKLFVYSDSLVVSLLPTVALRAPLASLNIQESIFFGTYDNPFCLCLLVFQNNTPASPSIVIRDFFSDPESLTPNDCAAAKYIE